MELFSRNNGIILLINYFIIIGLLHFDDFYIIAVVWHVVMAAVMIWCAFLFCCFAGHFAVCQRCCRRDTQRYARQRECLSCRHKALHSAGSCQRATAMLELLAIRRCRMAAPRGRDATPALRGAEDDDAR